MYTILFFILGFEICLGEYLEQAKQNYLNFTELKINIDFLAMCVSFHLPLVNILSNSIE